jgi:hypothetical protein
VAIEGDGFPDMQSFHHHEAERVAERVGLVLVGANQCAGALLIARTDPHDDAQPALDVVKECHRVAAAGRGP